MWLRAKLLGPEKRIFRNNLENRHGDRIKFSNSNAPSDVGSGKRRQNWLPDKGEPNSTQTNNSGNTTKKYGPDGNVQKEYNE